MTLFFIFCYLFCCYLFCRYFFRGSCCAFTACPAWFWPSRPGLNAFCGRSPGPSCFVVLLHHLDISIFIFFVLSSFIFTVLFLPPYFYRLISTALLSPSYFHRLIVTVFSAVLWCVFDQGCNDDHRPQPLTHPTRSSKGPPLKQIILVMYTVCIKKQLLARAMNGRSIRPSSAKASAPGLYCKDLVG